MNNYGVVLFYTASIVMRAEKILIKYGLRIKLIPTPREFSSDCGTALRFEWDQAYRIQKLLEDAGVEIASMHPMQ